MIKKLYQDPKGQHELEFLNFRNEVREELEIREKKITSEMKNKLEVTQERRNINSTVRKVGEKDDFKD